MSIKSQGVNDMSQFFKSVNQTSNIYSITKPSANSVSIMPQVDEGRILMDWAHQTLDKVIKGTAKLPELYQLRSVLNEEASVKALEKVHPNLLPGYLNNIDKAINSLVNKQQQSMEQQAQLAVRMGR